MDPVSRRLAAAAMGVVFGLSRDDELEKTRLDLERARMEREDFRNGAGPDTTFMHYEVKRPFTTNYETCYKERMSAETIVTMHKNDTSRQEMYTQLSRDYDEKCVALSRARTLLAQVVRHHMLTQEKLRETTVNKIVDYFSEAHIDDAEVERYANDGLGEVWIGVSDSTDEETESHHERRVRSRT